MAVTTAAAARQRAMWRRINEEATRMRRASAPPFFEQKVMHALGIAATGELAAGAATDAFTVRPSTPTSRPVVGDARSEEPRLPWWMTIAAVAVAGALAGGLMAWLAR